MKLIKFRGFAKELNLWVFGFYFFSETENKHFILGESKDYGFQKMEVHPESVGQFIGLHNADGNEIFEGDIVLWGAFPAVCVFDEKNNWVFRNKLADFAVFGYANECKVIGNIYQKPELLRR